jgi:hypothetical protein
VRSNAERVIRRRKLPGPGCEGKSLESKNPMGVSGMKQGRALGRGASRREGEKPCGRNEPGEASRGMVDSPEPLRRRGEELHESCRKSQRSRILPWRIRAASSRLIGDFGGEREDTPFGVLGELGVRRV